LDSGGLLVRLISGMGQGNAASLISSEIIYALYGKTAIMTSSLTIICGKMLHSCLPAARFFLPGPFTSDISL
jgi:hypothetical protein